MYSSSRRAAVADQVRSGSQRHRDALANVVVEGVATTVTLGCPAARDVVEIGGPLAIYTAPVYEPDGKLRGHLHRAVTAPAGVRQGATGPRRI